MKSLPELSAVPRRERATKPPGVPRPRSKSGTNRAWPAERRRLAARVALLQVLDPPDRKAPLEASDAAVVVLAPKLLAEALAEVARLERKVAELERRRR
jgi:hypothetical protein